MNSSLKPNFLRYVKRTNRVLPLNPSPLTLDLISYSKALSSMLNFFKKKSPKLPPFHTLEQHPLRDKYFSRNNQWDHLNEKMIHVFDRNRPRMITMDPWVQLVFLEANGQRTVKDFVLHMASQYSSTEGIPAELDKTIIEMLESLIEDDNLVLIHNEPKELPYYLKLPIAEQNPEIAKIMMIADGFVEAKENNDE